MENKNKEKTAEQIIEDFNNKAKMVERYPIFDFLIKDEEIYISRYYDKQGRKSVKIPSFVKDFIGSDVFVGAKELNHVVFKNKPTTMYFAFAYFEGNKLILDVDTSNIVDMQYAFRSCRNLKYLDLGTKFDTSNVKDMNHMFSRCESLENFSFIDNFNTENVVDMSFMFEDCRSVKNFNLKSGFNTSNVKDMQRMFQLCVSLKEIKLGSSFDTHNVENMHEMFSELYSLEQLDLGNKFDTHNVKTMCKMFSELYNLKELNLGNKFDTSKVHSMYKMFSQCYDLKSLKLGNKFRLNNSEDNNIFEFCKEIKKLDISKLNTYTKALIKEQLRHNNAKIKFIE